MNRLQQILGMAVALGGFAPSRSDYPYRPQESVFRRTISQHSNVGTIPGLVQCHCTKCESGDTGYPTGKKHLYRTEGVTKGPKKLSRAQRKAKRK